MRVFCVFTRDRKKLWCGREDSNLHGIATASPSSWCVCQFRHYRTVGWYHSSYRMLTLQPPSVSKSFLSLPLQPSGRRRARHKFLTRKPNATVFSLAQGQTADSWEFARLASNSLVPKTKLAESVPAWTLPPEAAGLPELARRAAEFADRSATGYAYSAAV